MISFYKTGQLKNYKSLIKRLLFTFGILTLFQLGTVIQTPGVNLAKDIENDFFVLVSLFGGGALGKVSIFSLGISPFITASIIVQLLSSGLVPKLKEWRQQGHAGQAKINYLTKFLTIPIAYLQALGFIAGLQGIQDISLSPVPFGESLNFYFFVPLLWTAGTMIVIFLADMISSNGVGQGTSLIIFTGILGSMVGGFAHLFNVFLFLPGLSEFEVIGDIFILFGYFVLVFFIIFVILYFSKMERRIPIQQTGQGLRLKDHHKSYLPIKLNTSGVIPVIFASSIISFLGAIGEIITVNNPASGTVGANFANFYENFLRLNTVPGLAIFACLVFSFSMLYTTIALDTEQLAVNLKRSGAYILGIPSGVKTENYVYGILIRLNFFGSLYLATLAVLSPIIGSVLFGGAGGSAIVSGVSLLLVVVIGENIFRQVKHFITQINYINFVEYSRKNFLWSTKIKN